MLSLSPLPDRFRPLPDAGLLDLISALACLIEHGRVAFLNRAGAAMLGLDGPEAARDRPFTDFLDGEFSALIAEAGWDLLAAEEMLPLKLRRGAGWFEAELRVRGLPGHDGTYLIEARDISRFLRSAEALREREERLQGVLHSVIEGIVTIDERGVIEAVNPALGRIFATDPANLVGRPLGDLVIEVAPERRPDPTRPQPPVLATGRAVEALGRRADGSLFPLELSLSELHHGKSRLFTGILRDISERKEAEARISRLAHHDTLTGLPNRNLLADRITHALARVRRHGGHLAVLYVDLDRFKPINDRLGHKAGDVVLREVAARLSACIRGSDTVSRIGGDEFVVVIEQIARPVEAAMVARKILDKLARPIEVEGEPCQIGASIGIAVHPFDGNEMEEICKAADVAMYRVKNSGRNGFCFFSDTGDSTLPSFGAI
ncbi:diguanylate cyclase domain-containing protein [Phaeospirillum tilakii]|uniref:Diguanylate cyclase domain-containing protein n=1 Tax=Phaeospirillum tilakii TaxID=741673 RepID=A0ABW5CC54_9PROT